MTTQSTRVELGTNTVVRPHRSTSEKGATTKKRSSYDSWRGWEEHWREVYTPLLLQNEETRPKVLAVTSAMDGEGKTTLALGLAMCMARDLEKSIVLLDCNLARPTLSKSLNMAGAAGILNYLAKQASLQEIGHRGRLPNLWLVPAGSRVENPSRYIRSSVLVELIREASATFDTVILDTPSLLTATDARVVSSLANSLLLVVRAGVSTTHSVTKALGFVESVPSRGIVVNDFRSAVPSMLRRLILTV